MATRRRHVSTGHLRPRVVALAEPPEEVVHPVVARVGGAELVPVDRRGDRGAGARPDPVGGDAGLAVAVAQLVDEHASATVRDPVGDGGLVGVAVGDHARDVVGEVPDDVEGRRPARSRPPRGSPSSRWSSRWARARARAARPGRRGRPAAPRPGHPPRGRGPARSGRGARGRRPGSATGAARPRRTARARAAWPPPRPRRGATTPPSRFSTSTRRIQSGRCAGAFFWKNPSSSMPSG